MGWKCFVRRARARARERECAQALAHTARTSALLGHPAPLRGPIVAHAVGGDHPVVLRPLGRLARQPPRLLARGESTIAAAAAAAAAATAGLVHALPPFPPSHRLSPRPSPPPAVQQPQRLALRSARSCGCALLRAVTRIKHGAARSSGRRRRAILNREQRRSIAASVAASIAASVAASITASVAARVAASVAADLAGGPGYVRSRP